MLAAATAWEGLAAELHSMAAAYESALAELTADWQGASSATMTAAATPYVTWIRSTAAQTEQAAAQGRAAAAAYEAAFAATVPPPMIVANRNLLTTLIATNILGQNTPAIAATEAYYATMWAQDATAMYCYAGSSAAATRLIPFTRPPQTAEPVGTTGQSAAVTQATGNSINSNVQTQLLSLVPKTLRHLTTTVTAPSAAASSTSGAESILSGITTFMSQLTGPYSPLGQVGVSGGWWLSFGQILGLSQNVPGVASLLGPPTPVTGVLGPLSGGYMSAPALAPAGLGGGAVSGAMSRAGLVGALSVPPAWASAVPTVKTVAAVLSSTGLGAAPAIVADGQAGLLSSQMALSSMAGRAIGASAAQSIGGLATRTIGATAVCAIGTEAAEDLAGTVTILVIPPVE